MMELINGVIVHTRKPSGGVKPKPWESREGVYFVQWREYIKIGSAHDVKSRARALINNIPEGDVTPIAWIPVPFQRDKPWLAYYNHELEIHHALRDYRVRGEWFRDCPTVRKLIARYAKPWPWLEAR